MMKNVTNDNNNKYHYNCIYLNEHIFFLGTLSKF